LYGGGGGWATHLPLQTRRVIARPSHPRILVGAENVQAGQGGGLWTARGQVVGRVGEEGDGVEEGADGARDGEEVGQVVAEGRDGLGGGSHVELGVGSWELVGRSEQQSRTTKVTGS
jgi:hypothetical protein